MAACARSAGPGVAARGTIAWNERVRLVFSDVDETIAPLHGRATAPMLDELSSYLEQGGRLCLISGNHLGRITGGVTDGIEPRLRNRCLIAPLHGIEVWGFTPAGALRDTPFVAHAGESLTPEMQRDWRRLIDQLFDEFSLRPHASRPPGEFRHEVGDDPLDVMFADRGQQISLEFTNSFRLSQEQLAQLPYAVPAVAGQFDLRRPVLARAEELLADARLPLTPRLAGQFALNFGITGISKGLAVTAVLRSERILASIGLSETDVEHSGSLEVWGDNFAVGAGVDLDISDALPHDVRSIDFRDECPGDLPDHINLVLWDGEHLLEAGLLEYLRSRPRGVPSPPAGR